MDICGYRQECLRSGSELEQVDAIAQSVHLWTRCRDYQGVVRTGRQAFAGGMISGLCDHLGIDERVRELASYAFALLDDCGRQALPVTRILLGEAGLAGDAEAWSEGSRDARAFCASLFDRIPGKEEGVQYLGIDGCPAGWFFVSLDDDGSHETGVVSRIDELESRLERCALALIDIPIGLPSSTIPTRRADDEARRKIAPRGSSVFPVPSRPAIEAPDYRAACMVNERTIGRQLSKQTWNIVPKIREVDEFLRRRVLRQKLREMHPELAFWALNGRRVPTHPKKTPEGFAERLRILSRHFSGSADVYQSARAQHPLRREVGDDDILDALVGAVTALHYPNVEALPPKPQFDERGLPMEMVFARSEGPEPPDEGSAD